MPICGSRACTCSIQSSTMDISGSGGAGDPYILTTTDSTVLTTIYTDEADDRPDASIVFWVPSPVSLGNPFAAVEGDVVLRTSENPVQGLNGVTAIWYGTPTEYEALPALQAGTVYLLIAEP